MARYIERAENVARFIDVNLNLKLDLPMEPRPPVAAPDRHQRRTERFLERYGEATQDNVMQFLAFDTANPNSIYFLPAVGARKRPLGARNHLVGNVGADQQPVSADAGAPAMPELRRTGRNFPRHPAGLPPVPGHHRRHHEPQRGVAFRRLGRKLERADKTSRILDVKYFILLPSATTWERRTTTSNGRRC